MPDGIRGRAIFSQSLQDSDATITTQRTYTIWAIALGTHNHITSEDGVRNQYMRKESHIGLVMRRMGISTGVCPTNETLKTISDWCGLCYRGLKIKVSVLIYSATLRAAVFLNLVIAVLTVTAAAVLFD